jgi:hypothetical protein
MYRPAIKLLEEIIEDDTTYSGVLGFILWMLFSTIAAPWNLYLILQNNNEQFIEDFAVTLANRILESEDE